MVAYIAGRLLAAIPVLIVVTVFVFLLLYLSPGDPSALIAGDTASAAEIAQIRARLGLDDPILIKFWRWSSALLVGDLGVSLVTRLPVATLIQQRIEPTLSLAICALIVASSIAIPVGMAAAARAGSWFDRAVTSVAVLGFAVPSFVLAYGLILVFAVHWQLAPVQGYRSIRDGVMPFLGSMILPSLAVGFGLTALLTRVTRARMIEVLNEDFIRTATAKGLSRTRILFGHALRNGLVQIVTVMGSGFALLIGGTIVVETVFAIPGIGRLTVDAVLRRDYPVVQGVILLFSFSYVLVNLIVDIAYVAIDPRIEY